MNVRDHMHGRNTSGDLMTFPDIQRVALWQLQPPGMDDSVAIKARTAAAAVVLDSRRSHRVPTAAAVVPVRPRCVPCPLHRLRRPVDGWRADGSNWRLSWCHLCAVRTTLRELM